ncbi:GPW/gp25 family protein [Celerinatantimonas sp. YJH-8]|uniref:GPW/gp25 family protein n=1 Tax=Celerinatantimonas sp. YJH-8 TaxID=3228714 RepID=UPI0038BEA4EC
MQGMNRHTGKALSGIEHLKQSIIDILTTPRGSRLMRREYGSDLFHYIDAPMTAETRMSIINATVNALNDWETRIAVSKIEVTNASRGTLSLTITGVYRPNGQVITLEGIAIS